MPCVQKKVASPEGLVGLDRSSMKSPSKPDGWASNEKSPLKRGRQTDGITKPMSGGGGKAPSFEQIVLSGFKSSNALSAAAPSKVDAVLHQVAVIRAEKLESEAAAESEAKREEDALHEAEAVTMAFSDVIERTAQIEQHSDLQKNKPFVNTVSVMLSISKFRRKAKAKGTKIKTLSGKTLSGMFKKRSFQDSKSKTKSRDKFSKISSWRLRGSAANKGRAPKTVHTERRGSITVLAKEKRRKSLIEMSIVEKIQLEDKQKQEDHSKPYWSSTAKQGGSEQLVAGDECRVNYGRFVGQTAVVIAAKDSDHQCKVKLKANEDEPFFISETYLTRIAKHTIDFLTTHFDEKEKYVQHQQQFKQVGRKLKPLAQTSLSPALSARPPEKNTWAGNVHTSSGSSSSSEAENESEPIPAPVQTRYKYKPFKANRMSIRSSHRAFRRVSQEILEPSAASPVGTGKPTTSMPRPSALPTLQISSDSSTTTTVEPLISPSTAVRNYYSKRNVNTKGTALVVEQPTPPSKPKKHGRMPLSPSRTLSPSSAKKWLY